MAKKKKILYWVATLWLLLGMVSTGIVQLLENKEELALFTHLGYPVYLLALLAVCKFLAVFAILIPKFPLLKEWAYAGFFFTMSGAIFSHIAVNDGAKEIFPAVLLLLLTVASWYLRPPDRKTVFVNA